MFIDKGWEVNNAAGVGFTALQSRLKVVGCSVCEL